MVAERAIKPAGCEAAVFEIGDRSRTDRGRFGQVFPEALFLCEQHDAHASRGSRMGSPCVVC